MASCLCSEQTDAEADEALAKEIEKAAEQIVSEFEQGMQEVMENLEKAQLAFDDLSGKRSGVLKIRSNCILNFSAELLELVRGKEGFALS
jgi:hypothetical protein